MNEKNQFLNNFQSWLNTQNLSAQVKNELFLKIESQVLNTNNFIEPVYTLYEGIGLESGKTFVSFTFFEKYKSFYLNNIVIFDISNLNYFYFISNDAYNQIHSLGKKIYSSIEENLFNLVFSNFQTQKEKIDREENN